LRLRSPFFDRYIAPTLRPIAIDRLATRADANSGEVVEWSMHRTRMCSGSGATVNFPLGQFDELHVHLFETAGRLKKTENPEIIVQSAVRICSTQ
jgi:hypothetical protein